MRIVHICVAGSQPILSPFGGAVQRRILELAKVQAQAGHRVTAFSVGTSTDAVCIEGVSVRFIRCITPMPWRHIEYLFRILVALLLLPRPDVINCHGQPEALLIAKLLRRPAALFYDYYEFRGGREAPWGRLYKKLLTSFDLLLPCSSYCLVESLAHWGLEGRNAAVQYNGVNTLQFQPNPDAGQEERLRIGLSGPIILYVGRVNRQKGTDLLVQSIALLRQIGVDVTLVVAGPISQFAFHADRAELDSWTTLIRSVGGIYLGPVDDARLVGIYNMADVFVMPTRSLEMFGMAAVEAQACATPVVASDHGGLQETVPEAAGGRFPVGESEALTDALKRLVEDADLRRQCAEAALTSARRFTWERVASSLEASYRKVGIHG